MVKPKFTIEQHEERMRQILTQAEPTQRPNVLQSLLERARGRGVIPKVREPKL